MLRAALLGSRDLLQAALTHARLDDGPDRTASARVALAALEAALAIGPGPRYGAGPSACAHRGTLHALDRPVAVLADVQLVD